MPGSTDPYRTLGISPSASDAELRTAYRRLVQLHHPDHNGGSADAARRFEEVQEAYAQVRELRQSPNGSARGRSRTGSHRQRGPAPSGRDPSRPGPGDDPGLGARLAEMERELKAARDARERAIRDARTAYAQTLRDVRAARDRTLADARENAGAAGRDRPSDEELGYFSTDDSFSKILGDAASELSRRVADVGDSPAARKVSDLIDELTDKLTGQRPSGR